MLSTVYRSKLCGGYTVWGERIRCVEHYYILWGTLLLGAHTVHRCYPRYITHSIIHVSHSISPTVYHPQYKACHPQYITILSHSICMFSTVYKVTHRVSTMLPTVYMCYPRHIIYPRYIPTYTVGNTFPTVYTCSPQYIIYCGEHYACSPQYIPTVYNCSPQYTPTVYMQNILWVYTVGNIKIYCGEHILWRTYKYTVGNMWV